MPETIDLVGQAIEKNPVDFKDTFDQLMRQRIVDSLENKKIELAQSIYGMPETDDADDLDDIDDVGDDDFDVDADEDDVDDDLDFDDLDLDDLDIDLDELDLEGITDDEDA